MRRNSLFWAVVLILVGTALLLGNLFNVNVWSLIWPLFLIALGSWILWGILAGPRPVEAEQVAIPLEGAGQARLRIHHGAGRLHINAGAGQDELAAGTFGGGLDYRSRREGDILDVEMRVPAEGFPRFIWPWMWRAGGALDWSFSLNGGIPLSLDLETGASDTRLDLADLRVTDLKLQTGASATVLTLPAHAGHTQVHIGAGAASVAIRVPSGVAARVRVKGGLAGIAVDKGRFPRMGDVYQSAGYDTAPNKVDVNVETGVGSVDVR